MNHGLITLGVVSVLALTGCQTKGFSLKEGQTNLAENSIITTEWGDGKRFYCNQSTSPAITGTGVPVKGIANVKAWFVDLNYLPYPHNGAIFPASKVLSADGVLNIPQDSIANAPGESYKSACSKVGGHKYQFTVYFLNAAGEAIGIKETSPSPYIP